MNVAVADVGPVVEPDAELEGGLRGRHEFALVDLHQGVEALDRGDGGFTHAHGAYQVGLHQDDLELCTQPLDEAVGRQPARGATARDDDARFAGTRHRFRLWCTTSRMRRAFSSFMSASAPWMCS